MPFIRALILLLAIWLAFVLVRQLYRSSRQGRSSVGDQGSRHDTTLPYTTMVACDTCRTHIPKTEAICLNGRYFCSEPCRQQGEATP
jgi:hypothetical protein